MRSRLLALSVCSAAALFAPALGWATEAPCTQANALAVQTTHHVATAIVPNGSWAYGTTGIRIVALEGSTSAPISIATDGIVDSCAANTVTHETVCTSTGRSVYLINGTTLTTLKSNGNGQIGFSGGDCTNCAVAIDTATNIAYIEEATSNASASDVPSLQALNLNTNTFETPLKLNNGLSESITVDPVRGVLLSAAENSIYDIIKLDKDTGRPQREFGNSSIDAEYDSAGEDCTTGFMLGSDEFTGDLYLGSISSVKYDTTDKTWSDKHEQLVHFPQFSQLSAGTTALSVAPGTHYAILGGEFGGNIEGFLELPSTISFTKGALKDFVIVTLPNDPAGNAFQNGYDPHAVTSYVSPNNGKAYAVWADWSTGAPDYLAVVDIAAMMAAPRVTGGYSNGKHVVDPSYDLIAHGIVTYVQTH